jgi:enoyl-CoA hydratase
LLNLLLVEKSEGVATVTLNRPEAMNALSQVLCAELAEAFEALERNAEIRVAILTGAGERAFTAGLDLKELAAHPRDPAVIGGASRSCDPVKALEGFNKPLIGAINGVAITGGLELALACDVLIASTSARFADTHARIGITPGWGLSQKLSRAIGIYRAKELSLTGNFLDADTACAWGLVNRVVAPAELMPVARRLALDMASIPTDFNVFYKKLINDGFALPFAEALALETERANARNANVAPETVEANRKAVLARGRAQGRNR